MCEGLVPCLQSCVPLPDFFFYADYVGSDGITNKANKDSIEMDSNGCWQHDGFLARAGLGFGRRHWPEWHTSQATTWRPWRTTPGYATGIALGQYRLLVTMGSLCLQHTWKHCPCAWDAGGSRCPIFALRVPCLEGSWRNAKGELGTSHWFFTYFKNGHMRLFAQTAFRAQPV